MKHFFYLLSSALLFHTTVHTMERQKLLGSSQPTTSHVTTSLSSELSVNGSYQHGGATSETLAELSQRRNSNKDPFFSAENHQKNMTLVKLI